VEDPVYKLEVEAMELGPNSRAVGLELIEPATREPLVGADAAGIWAAMLPALAAGEPWVLDFFAHLERVREYCREKGIEFREANPRVVVISPPSAELLAALLGRFAGERFGARAGGPGIGGDPELEGHLAARGVDAYDAAYRNCLFCAVCDFESGFLTLLSERLGASEVIRRAQPAVDGLGVEVTRPS
jgi:hypothetical protein